MLVLIYAKMLKYILISFRRFTRTLNHFFTYVVQAENRKIV